MLKTVMLFLSLGGVCFASSTVATVTSPQPLAVDGHALVGVTISSWPLVSGDELATSNAPATISFKDGSSVELAKGSSATVAGTVDEPRLILTGGSVDYKIAPGSKFVISKAAAVPAPSPVVPSSASVATVLRFNALSSPLTYASLAGAGAAALALSSMSSSSGTISTPVTATASSQVVAHTSYPVLGCPSQAYSQGYIYAVDLNYRGFPLTCFNPITGALWYQQKH